MLGGRSLRPWLLLLTAALLFVAECRIFHYPLATGIDALGLFALILVPSYALVWIGARLAGLPLRMACSMSVAVLMLNTVLIFFGLYNLQQFHFTPDGGILTRGLFGVDIPWLAGEVHGIRLFGTLRDLHQFATPWQYHDATYRLLALFPRERTLSDLAFAAPLVGYTLLGCSVLALAKRLTQSNIAAWTTVAAWFLVAGFVGLDQSSYALSPSFVFGSLVFVWILLLLDVRTDDMNGARRVAFDLLIAALLLLLAETKLTTFVVLAVGLGVLSIIALVGKRWRWAVEMVAILAVPVVLIALQSKPNPYMPTDDFLVGAPLMGYGNHLANLLHMPAEALDPVSHGFSLTWRSLLIPPFFVFHFVRFAIGDPRILAALIALIFASGSIKRDVHRLCVVLIPIGFLMPVLYSPAWYPLALSFYAPLVSTQAAVLITVPLAFAMLRGIGQARRLIPVAAIGIMLLVGFLANGWSIVKQDRGPQNIVGADFIRAMESIAKKNDSAVVVTRRFDYEKPGDESYFWYAALSAHPVLSEGAKYGAFLAAVADTDAAKGLHRVKEAAGQLETLRRCIIGMIYDGDPCERGVAPARFTPGFEDLIYDLDLKYVVVDHTIGDRGDGPAFKAMDTLVSNEACTVLKIPDSVLDRVAKTRKPAR